MASRFRGEDEVGELQAASYTARTVYWSLRGAYPGRAASHPEETARRVPTTWPIISPGFRQLEPDRSTTRALTRKQAHPGFPTSKYRVSASSLRVSIFLRTSLVLVNPSSTVPSCVI